MFTDALHGCELPCEAPLEEIKRYWVCEVCGTEYKVSVQRAYRWHSRWDNEVYVTGPQITFEAVQNQRSGNVSFQYPHLPQEPEKPTTVQLI